MLILGIDPGLERIGFGLIDKAGSKLKVVDYGLIQTPRIEILQRFLLIERQIQEILEKHPVDLAGCERLFFSKNQTTGIDVAKALGVSLNVARRWYRAVATSEGLGVWLFVAEVPIGQAGFVE